MWSLGRTGTKLAKRLQTLRMISAPVLEGETSEMAVAVPQAAPAVAHEWESRHILGNWLQINAYCKDGE